MRFHLPQINREVGGRHLLFQYLFQLPIAARTVQEKAAFRLFIQRAKERKALDVVPMEVRDKNMRDDGPVYEFFAQVVSKIAEAGAAVKDVNLLADTYFDAGGIASIAHVFRLRSWSGPADAPKFDAHSTAATLCAVV